MKKFSKIIIISIIIFMLTILSVVSSAKPIYATQKNKNYIKVALDQPILPAINYQSVTDKKETEMSADNIQQKIDEIEEKLKNAKDSEKQNLEAEKQYWNNLKLAANLSPTRTIKVPVDQPIVPAINQNPTLNKGEIQGNQSVTDKKETEMSADNIQQKIDEIEEKLKNAKDSEKQNLETEKQKWINLKSQATSSSTGTIKVPVDQLSTETNNSTKDDDSDEDQDEEVNKNTPLGWIETALDGIVGILFIFRKLMFIALSYTVYTILSGALGSSFTIESILFNQVKDGNKVGILSVDFFDSTKDNNSEANNAIQENIAMWYVSIRNLSITILVIIALYIAIRMLLATTADGKAQYKTILLYWVQSLALIFVLHYIMIGIIAINNGLVKAIYNAGKDVMPKENVDITNTILKNAVLDPRFTIGWANAIAFCVLMFITMMFFLLYLKRMLNAAFLIIIAPLITITYSIDKIGDGKSQALNSWLKEFAYNILIQPFHCITYLAIGSIGAKLMAGSKPGEEGGIAKILIGMYFLSFIITSEGIVKKIFGIEANNIGTAVGEAAFIGTVMGKIGQTSKNKMNYTGDSKTNEFLGKKEVGLGIKRKPRIGSSNTAGTGAAGAGATGTGAAGTGPAGTGKTLLAKAKEVAGAAKAKAVAGAAKAKAVAGAAKAKAVAGAAGAGATGTGPAGTGPAAQQNSQDWYSHYNKDDERREELNNNPNRTQVENNELARNNARARSGLRRKKLIRGIGNIARPSNVIRGSLTMANLALAIATGDAKAITAAGFATKDHVKNNMDEAVERYSQQTVADSYQLARKVSPEKDADYFKDLANGEVDPANAEEATFMKDFRKYQTTMNKHGKMQSDEERIKEDNNRLLDNINAGRVDEKSGITRVIRIAGKKVP